MVRVESYQPELWQDYGLGFERVPFTCRIPDLMVFRTAALRRDRAETDEIPFRIRLAPRFCAALWRTLRRAAVGFSRQSGRRTEGRRSKLKLAPQP
jgi:hypothetical protein